MLYNTTMKNKYVNNLRFGLMTLMAVIICISLINNNILSSILSTILGMALIRFLRAKSGAELDERDNLIREKAAQWTLAVFTPAIGLVGFLVFLFARGKLLLWEQIGATLAYISFFQISAYSIFIFYLNRKFGGNDKE